VLASLIPPALLAFSGPPVRLLWLAVPVAVLLGGHRWMSAEGGVPVLVYHSVSDDPRWLPWAKGISVNTAAFERHLGVLRALGCSVLSTNDLMRARRRGGSLPKRPVVLHLDDGYLDNWVAAHPLLQRNGMKATLFVSLDFVQDGEELRPSLGEHGLSGGAGGSLADRVSGERGRSGEPGASVMPGRSDIVWNGYLNWAELRAMDSSGVVDVQSHGVDHNRVVTSARVVDTVRRDNWRRAAWVQWARMQGNKCSWHRYEEPPLVPYGSPIYESAPALAARAWLEGRPETPAEYEARVRNALMRSRAALGKALGKEIEVFCWPYNTATPAGRRIAAEAGYLATTGGKGENRAEEDPQVISRVTAHDMSLGGRLPWLDALALRATVRLGHGNYYWYIVVLSMKAAHRVAGWLGVSRVERG
jgi:peptidoglycan/xylan/chitin deacetylase (PgdA/CDA1 family)